MNKINKNLIISVLGILAVFVFTASVPKEVNAYWSANTARNYNYSYSGPAYTNNYSGGSSGGYINNNTGNTGTTTPTTTAGQISTSGVNPIPTISQISPSSAPANSEVITITITGSKFMQGSIGRVNDEDRTTNYIRDEKTGRIKSTILTMVLTKEDLSSNKPLSITVFNPAPGGGTSNSITFNDKEKNNSNLAANAIFGDNGFMPKSFIQWLMLFVLIFLGVLLFRKTYRKDEKYKETPLKHD